MRAKILAAAGAGAAAYAAGLSAPLSVVVGLGTPLVVMAGPVFLRGVLVGATTKATAERVPAAVADMSGEQFEDYVALAARSCGLHVMTTPLSGDFGVDIVVGTRPNRVAIQCKRQARPVGTAAVQQVVAGAAMHDCTRTMVVTNNHFTAAARRLADQHGCVLIDGDQLSLLRSAIRDAAAELPAT